jgi:hypothetical protein
VEPDKDRDPKFWRRDHLTNLAISYLIDDEIPDDVAVSMRQHFKVCRACRKELLRRLGIENKLNPQG